GACRPKAAVRSISVGARITEDERNRAGEDGEVERGRPFLDIAVVRRYPVAHAAGIADLAAKTIDLGIAGQPGTSPEARRIGRDQSAIVLVMRQGVRPGTD